MNKYILSPNEIARLVNEERTKLRIERLKQVREQSKVYSTTVRSNVEEERQRLTDQLTGKLKSKWEETKMADILKAQENLEKSMSEIGKSHRNAAELNYDSIIKEKAKKNRENHSAAMKRQKAALEMLREEREQQLEKDVQHHLDRYNALAVEKSRAAMIAALPKPEPKPEPKDLVPKEVPTQARNRSGVVVEKEFDDSLMGEVTAAEEAMIIERKNKFLEEERQRFNKERRMAAQLRHLEALDKEHEKQEEQTRIINANESKKEDIAMRKLEINTLSKQLLVNNLKRKEKMERDAALADLPMGPLESIQSSILDVTPESTHVEECSEAVRVRGAEPLAGTSKLLEGVEVKGQDEELSSETHSRLSSLRCAGQSREDHPPTSEPQNQRQFYLDEKTQKLIQEKIASQKKEWTELQREGKEDVSLQTDPIVHRGSGYTEGPDDDLSNSCSTAYHSIEIPSYKSSIDAQEVPDGNAMDEIMKKKKKLLEDLMLIEHQKSLLEKVDDDEDEEYHTPSSEQNINNNAQTNQSSELTMSSFISRILNETTSGDRFIPLNNLSSPGSSGCSTQFLEIPKPGREVKNCGILPLYDSDTRYSDLEPVSPSSRNSYNSSRTSYMDLPNLEKNSSSFKDKMALSEAKIDSFFGEEIPADESHSNANPKTQTETYHDKESDISNYSVSVISGDKTPLYLMGLQNLLSSTKSKYFPESEHNSTLVSIEFEDPDAESSRLSNVDRSSLGQPELSLISVSTGRSHTISNSTSGRSENVIRPGNHNDNNNSNSLNGESTSGGTKDSSTLQSSASRNWSQILEPYKISELDEANYVHSQPESIMISLSNEDFGILEEPDLTLVSADTTMSGTESFLQSSVRASSSSLTSFEELTGEKEQTNSLSATTASRLRPPQSTSHISPPIQKNLMYPSSEEIHKSLRETMKNWKTSRSAASDQGDQRIQRENSRSPNASSGPNNKLKTSHRK